jgi:hypothetical protein
MDHRPDPVQDESATPREQMTIAKLDKHTARKWDMRHEGDGGKPRVYGGSEATYVDD